MFKIGKQKLFFFTLVILLAATLSTPSITTVASSSTDFNQLEVSSLIQEETIEMIRASTNVVFDESHSPFFNMLGWYEDFANFFVDNGYTVSNITSGTTIDASVLASVDILIIACPQTSYSASELDAIENWVKNGGGKLFLISDNNQLNWHETNDVANQFGIVFGDDMLEDSDDQISGNEWWVYLDGALGSDYYAGNLANHRIMEGVSRIELLAADGISTQPEDAVNLVQTDNDETATWVTGGSPANGVPMMLVINGGTAGNGTLVTITDGNLFSNATDTDGDGLFDFDDSDHKVLALNTIDYLANPTFGPNVVFDESKSPYFTIDSRYLAFAGTLRVHGYNVSTITVGTTIDATVLASVDIMCIAMPQNAYSTSELNAMETWVNNGGKLFLLTEWGGYGQYARPIADRFDIKYEGDQLWDHNEYVDAAVHARFYLSDNNINPHYITLGINRIEVYRSDGIAKGPADNMTIVKTDDDGSCDWTNGSDALNIPIMMVLDEGSIGSGKLVTIGEASMFASDEDTDLDGDLNFYDSDNEVLALNTIKWLATSWTVQPKRINNILVYSDDTLYYGGGDYREITQNALVALNNLGYDNVTHTSDLGDFITLLTTHSWDLVIISQNWWSLITPEPLWDALKTYVDSGGFCIITTTDIESASSHALWAAMGGAHNQNKPYPPPAENIYWWNTTSPVLSTPNSVPDFTCPNRRGYIDNGDAMTVAAGGIGIAGYTESPTLGNSTIIVGSSGKTILNSFRIDQNRRDLDNDGKLDAVELWENEIASLVWVSIDLESDKTEYDSGEEVTLTATVTTLLGVPISSTSVDFTVYLPDNSTYTSDTNTTDSSGVTSFTFALEDLDTDDDGTWTAEAATTETQTEITFTVNVEETNWLLYAAIAAAVVFLLLLIVIIKKKRG